MRLHRSRQNKVIAGVAGGMAEAWGTSAALVRVLWVIGALLMPPMTAPLALLLYLVLALTLPPGPEQ